MQQFNVKEKIVNELLANWNMVENSASKYIMPILFDIQLKKNFGT